MPIKAFRLLLVVLFVFLTATAQSSCWQRACKALDAIGRVRVELAEVGILYGSDEALLRAVMDGSIDRALGEVTDRDRAVAAIKALLAIIRALCPDDREALESLLLSREFVAAPSGGTAVDVLERRLEELAGAP